MVLYGEDNNLYRDRAMNTFFLPYIGISKDTYLWHLIPILAKMYVCSNEIWALSRIPSSNPKPKPFLDYHQKILPPSRQSELVSG